MSTRSIPLRVCAFAGLAIAGLLCGSVAAESKADRIKAEICDLLVDVATWCHENGMDDVAAGHVAEARVLLKRHKGAAQLERSLRKDTSASEAGKAKYERTVWKRAAPRIAAAYLKLFKQPHGAKQQQAFDDYLVRAYRLSPSKARSTFDKTWKAALKKEEKARVRRLLLAVADLEKDGKPNAARAAALEATAPGSVRLAKSLLDLAGWCRAQGLGAKAEELLVEAHHHDPDSRAVAALRAEIEDPKAAGEEAAQEAFAARWDTERGKLAAAYLEMAQDLDPKKDRGRMRSVYLVRALELDPERVGPRFEKAWRDAEAKKDFAEVSALLLRARDVATGEETGKVRAAALEHAELEESVRRPIYRKASGHEMRYWLCLPPGWTPEKKWPVAVCCDGRLCVFKARAQAFLRNRGERPFIIVSPCTFANTNDLKAILTGFTKEKGFTEAKPTNKYLVPPEYLTAREVLTRAVVQHYPDALIDHMNPRRGERAKFDVAGLQAVLADVREKYGGEERVYITGWSGGGMLTWSMTLGYTHLVAAAAPACANFLAAIHKAAAPNQTFAQDPFRKELPIHAFQGLKDRYLAMLEQQWSAAVRTCEALGFENVKRTDLPDVAHKDCVKQVWDFFEEVRLERARKAEPSK